MLHFCIQSINDGTVFHVVKNNFKVESNPVIPFDSKLPAKIAPPPMSIAPPVAESDNEHHSFEDAVASVSISIILREEIINFHGQGIKR